MSASPVIVAASGLATAVVVIQLLLRFDLAKILVRRGADWHHDRRGQIPRLGGVALVAAFLATEFWMGASQPELGAESTSRKAVRVASLAMFLLGLWDDFRPIRAEIKLTVQVLIAAGVCWCGVGMEVLRVPFVTDAIPLGEWGPVLTVLWLVALTNLINMIDGLDGLAGGIALMVMVLLVAVAHPLGRVGLLACGLAGGLVGFLYFNFPPARIYLGDSGAYFLGMQIGLFTIINSHKGMVLSALAAPLFVLALPVVDVFLTLARRGLRGLPLFRPDRAHLHHRLVAADCSRRRLMLYVYGLNLVLLLIGWAVCCSGGQWLPIWIGAAAVWLFVCGLAWDFSRRWFAVHRVIGGCWRMRSEVRYALSLTRWLELEGRRRAGPDELWPDFVFAADKLGFAGLKLTLENGQRVWHRPQHGRNGVWRLYDCPDPSFGRLEFGGPACPLVRARTGGYCARDGDCANRPGACLANPPVFETLSDLLAETWHKAAAGWQERRIPVRFRTEQAQAGQSEKPEAIPQPPYERAGRERGAAGWQHLKWGPWLRSQTGPGKNT